MAEVTPVPDGEITRRGLLRSAVGTTAAVAATASGTTPALAQGDEPDYDGWFDDVSNYDGTVDERGKDTVEVTVGAEGNDGNFAFGPAAVMVSPGTTVLWEWNGEGGVHNVVAEDDSYSSGDPVAEAGTTFEHTFESEGISKYYCAPHRGLGMKGAVVVRSGGGDGEDGGDEPAQTGPPENPDFDGYLDDTSNFDGTTVDRTGQSEATVTVGAQGNNGNFAFGPAAIRVSPGTTVVWEWNGEGGVHNVVAEDTTFDSGDPVAEAGTTFEYTFEETGIWKYFCAPHKGLGMKGAVVVGAPPGSAGGEEETREPLPAPGLSGTALALLAAFFAPLAYAAVARRRKRRRVRTAAATEAGAESGAEEPTETAVTREAPREEPAVELDHEEYEPIGTAALVAFYFVLIGLLWVFMYFIEFLGRVSVTG